MSLQDPIRVVGVILVIAMTMIIAFFVWMSFVDVFNSMTEKSVNEGTLTLAQNASIGTAIGNFTTGLSSMDQAFPIIVIGLMLVSLIFAFKSGASIIYSILSIVMWAFALFFAMIFKGVWNAFIVNFSSTSTSFPIVAWFMTNLSYIVIAWVFLISIVMFTRSQKEVTQNMSADQVFSGGLNVR